VNVASGIFPFGFPARIVKTPERINRAEMNMTISSLHKILNNMKSSQSSKLGAKITLN
jgi:hypothetical protein